MRTLLILALLLTGCGKKEELSGGSGGECFAPTPEAKAMVEEHKILLHPEHNDVKRGIEVAKDIAQINGLPCSVSLFFVEGEYKSEYKKDAPYIAFPEKILDQAVSDVIKDVRNIVKNFLPGYEGYQGFIVSPISAKVNVTTKVTNNELSSISAYFVTDSYSDRTMVSHSIRLNSGTLEGLRDKIGKLHKGRLYNFTLSIHLKGRRYPWVYRKRISTHNKDFIVSVSTESLDTYIVDKRAEDAYQASRTATLDFDFSVTSNPDARTYIWYSILDSATSRVEYATSGYSVFDFNDITGFKLSPGNKMVKVRFYEQSRIFEVRRYITVQSGDNTLAITTPTGLVTDRTKTATIRVSFQEEAAVDGIIISASFELTDSNNRRVASGSSYSSYLRNKRLKDIRISSSTRILPGQYTLVATIKTTNDESQTLVYKRTLVVFLVKGSNDTELLIVTLQQ